MIFSGLASFCLANTAFALPKLEDYCPQEMKTPAISIPCLKTGFKYTASLLYLQPGADNLGWAVITTYLPLASPTWNVQTIKPHFIPGFTLGTNYVFANSGNDLQLNWSHLQTSDRSTVTVSNFITQWISPFSQTGTLPMGGEPTGIFSLKSATAKLKFYYDVLNVDFGQSIDFCDFMRMRIFTGLSGVRIREKLITTFSGRPLPILTLNNTSTYLGLGPRLGINNTFGTCYNANIFFQFTGTLFVGRLQPAQYEFTASATDLANIGIAVNRESVSSRSVTKIVPAVEGKLGLTYLYNLSECSNLNFEFGYQAALYIKPLSSYETNMNVIGLDSGSLSTASVKYTESNFSVGGPYITVTWDF